MTNQETKKPDDELSFILVACGIFTIALLIVDFTYGNIYALLNSWWVWPFGVLHAGVVALWAIVIAKINDPKFDVCRKYLIAINIAALFLVLGHRAVFIGDKMFQEDVKPKQEQAK